MLFGKSLDEAAAAGGRARARPRISRTAGAASSTSSTSLTPDGKERLIMELLMTRRSVGS